MRKTFLSCSSPVRKLAFMFKSSPGSYRDNTAVFLSSDMELNMGTTFLAALTLSTTMSGFSVTIIDST